MSPRKWQILACALLILASLAAYEGLRHHEFINFDDNVYLTENRPVQEGLTLPGLVWAFTATHACNWHPVTWLSHMLDCQLFGLQPGPHHLVNLLFHLANTLLLFFWFLRTTGDRGPSLFVAALFALHPLHVESVAWAAERKDVLSAFFWLLTMWAYLRYAENPGPGRYFLIVLWLALGLMSKPMLVTLPCVLLLLDYWPLGRWRWPGESGVSPPETSGGPRVGVVSLKRLILEKVPLLALAAIFSVITLHAQKEALAQSLLQKLPLASRLANALAAYLGYLGKALWPANLGVLYPHEIAIPWWRTGGAALVLIFLSFFLIRQGVRRPYLAVGWLWFLGTLVPVIGLVHVGYQSMADRYTYLPFIGLFIIAAWGLKDLAAKWRVPARLLIAGAGAVLVALTVCTWLQVRHWRDSFSLFTHTLKVTGENPVMHTSLGVALAAAGQTEEAIVHYEKALSLEPNYHLAHNNLGAALAGQGKIDQAIAHYQEAVHLDPDYAEALENLGDALLYQGRLTEAVVHYQKLVRIQPKSPEAHYKFAYVAAELGELDLALSHYQQAIHLQPEHPRALNNLALVLATAAAPGLRDGPRAVRLAEEANRLSGSQNPTMMYTLAAAYAEAARFSEAVETSLKARDLAQAAGEEELATAIEARMLLYQACRPYREGQGD